MAVSFAYYYTGASGLFFVGENMRYIIMCGGTYQSWKWPRQLTGINGESIVARTIRLLRGNGVQDIAISSNNPIFEQFGLPVLRHENRYEAIQWEENGV